MIGSVKKLIVYFNDEDEENLRITQKTLEKLQDIFEEKGNCTPDEAKVMEEAIHIVNEVLRGEMF